MKQFFLIPAVLTIMSTHSIEISQQQLEVLQKNTAAIAQQTNLTDIEPLSTVLKNLKSIEENTLLKFNTLKQFSTLKPTSAQRNWVTEQLNSTQTLQMRNPDHPNQLIDVIDISQQAASTLKQWTIADKATTFFDQWMAQNWSWQQFNQHPDNTDFLALENALAQADKLSIDWLFTKLIDEQQLPRSSNRLLFLLFKKLPSSILAEQLWRNETDQFSYQTLQTINTIFDTERAIEQLSYAMNNKHLLSQALLLLAKHYPTDEVAHGLLLNKLQQPNSSWLAAAAISGIKQEAFIDKVKNLAQYSNAPAIQYAHDQLMQGDK
ncbi:hypothetical protein AAD001_00365 [Colwelliaceae bacterium 6471]